MRLPRRCVPHNDGAVKNSNPPYSPFRKGEIFPSTLGGFNKKTYKYYNIHINTLFYELGFNIMKIF